MPCLSYRGRAPSYTNETRADLIHLLMVTTLYEDAMPPLFTQQHNGGELVLLQGDVGAETQNRGGGGLLVYGASTVEFQDSAVFK